MAELVNKEKIKKRKYYTFWRQFNEKPSILLPRSSTNSIFIPSYPPATIAVLLQVVASAKRIGTYFGSLRSCND